MKGRVHYVSGSLPFEAENANRESKRGEASLKSRFPLSFEGEGDTGGEVDKQTVNLAMVIEPSLGAQKEAGR